MCCINILLLVCEWLISITYRSCGTVVLLFQQYSADLFASRASMYCVLSVSLRQIQQQWGAEFHSKRFQCF